LERIPDQLLTNYKTQTRKSSPVIEHLKIAAALKLWNDRDFKDIKFEVPIAYGKKTVFVKVLAKNDEGVVFGVECASTVRLDWLRKRIETLQACLPRDSYIIAVFPQTAAERAQKAAKFADEVWVTGKKDTVTQMIFTSTFHKE